MGNAAQRQNIETLNGYLKNTNVLSSHVFRIDAQYLVIVGEMHNLPERAMRQQHKTFAQFVDHINAACTEAIDLFIEASWTERQRDNAKMFWTTAEQMMDNDPQSTTLDVVRVSGASQECTKVKRYNVDIRDQGFLLFAYSKERENAEMIRNYSITLKTIIELCKLLVAQNKQQCDRHTWPYIDRVLHTMLRQVEPKVGSNNWIDVWDSYSRVIDPFIFSHMLRTDHSSIRIFYGGQHHATRLISYLKSLPQAKPVHHATIVRDEEMKQEIQREMFLHAQHSFETMASFALKSIKQWLKGEDDDWVGPLHVLGPCFSAVYSLLGMRVISFGEMHTPLFETWRNTDHPLHLTYFQFLLALQEHQRTENEFLDVFLEADPIEKEHIPSRLHRYEDLYQDPRFLSLNMLNALTIELMPCLKQQMNMEVNVPCPLKSTRVLRADLRSDNYLFPDRNKWRSGDVLFNDHSDEETRRWLVWLMGGDVGRGYTDRYFLDNLAQRSKLLNIDNFDEHFQAQRKRIRDVESQVNVRFDRRMTMKVRDAVALASEINMRDQLGGRKDLFRYSSTCFDYFMVLSLFSMKRDCVVLFMGQYHSDIFDMVMKILKADIVARSKNDCVDTGAAPPTAPSTDISKDGVAFVLQNI